MQYEDSTLPATKPPAIAIFALIDLALMLGHKNRTRRKDLRS
jgi:hypothetical protein